MTGSIRLGSDANLLQIDVARNALSLYPGLAGAQIELRLTAYRTNAEAANTFYQTCAVMYFGPSSNMGRRRVGEVRQSGSRSFGISPQQINLVGLVTDEQLRAAEELRAGGDLWITLELEMATIAYAEGGLTTYSGTFSFPVTPGEWGPQVENVEAGGYVEVLVPVPKDPEYAKMVRRLAEARALLLDGKIDAAIGAARLALEPVLEETRTVITPAALKAINGKDRTLEQRIAAMVEATHSALCGAMHDDDLTKTFHYTRTDAQTLIVATAGLVKQHTERR